MKFTFFGSSRFSILVLDELERSGFLPTSIVTTPDRPKGRKLLLTPTPVKEWGQKRKIPVHDPEKLDEEFAKTLKKEKTDVFIIASYGKIIPEMIISVPPRKTLNVHPSLLPKYRGASPLQSAILDDVKQTGVTLMRVDEKVDHGPIVAAKEISINEWPIYEEFEEMVAKVGGELLAQILPDWVSGKIPEQEQNHAEATYTKKISKDDGCLDFNDDQYLNFRKIQAYHEWPQAYFYYQHGSKKIRVKVTQASFKDGKLIIERVIPEGGNEMTSADFNRGYKKS